MYAFGAHTSLAYLRMPIKEFIRRETELQRKCSHGCSLFLSRRAAYTRGFELLKSMDVFYYVKRAPAVYQLRRMRTLVAKKKHDTSLVKQTYKHEETPRERMLKHTADVLSARSPLHKEKKKSRCRRVPAPISEVQHWNGTGHHAMSELSILLSREKQIPPTRCAHIPDRTLSLPVYALASVLAFVPHVDRCARCVRYPCDCSFVHGIHSGSFKTASPLPFTFTLSARAVASWKHDLCRGGQWLRWWPANSRIVRCHARHCAAEMSHAHPGSFMCFTFYHCGTHMHNRHRILSVEI